MRAGAGAPLPPADRAQHRPGRRTTFEAFHAIVSARSRPVVLLEGRRDLPEEEAGVLAAFLSEND